MPHAPIVTPHNRLLRSLAPQDLAQLIPELEVVSLKPQRILHHARVPIEHVYFIESGLVSVLSSTDGVKHGVGVWLIGREGMVGISAVLGMEASPHRRIVQSEGSALRMRVTDLRSAMDDLPSLRPVLLRYVNGVLVQAGQSGVCNASHSLSQRLARWLLMVHDHLDCVDLPVTHAAIAKMLGARRASITEGIHILAKNNVIAQGRRLIRIVDRERLEHLSCSCYRTMRIEFERHLLPRQAQPSLRPTCDRPPTPSARAPVSLNSHGT